MQAVIKTGGKQYIVSKGDKINVGKLLGDPGTEIAFDEVLLVNDKDIKIGTPLVNGAKVLGKIVSHKKSKKIIVFKYKRRKGYHKKQGHRQDLTCVEIQKVRA